MKPMKSVLVASVITEHLKKNGPSSIGRLTRELRFLTKKQVASGLALAAAIGAVHRSHGGLVTRFSGDQR